jgi:shikimate kinase / 3-dehydroquinate synthase
MTQNRKRDKFIRTTFRFDGKNMNHIFLYGPPGAGKSSTGHVLADNLNLEFLDLDAEIEKVVGTSISQIMAEWGEAGFRDIETTTLKRVIKGKTKIIALGGGALLRVQNRTIAESKGAVVFLDADLHSLLARLGSDASARPLLAGNLEEQLYLLLERRQKHYGSFGLRVTSSGKTPDEIAAEIQLLLGRYRVKGMGKGYDVLFQPGGFDDLVNLLRESGLGPPVAIVCDEKVAPLYGDRLLTVLRRAGYGYNHPHMITIPSGEQYKTLESVTKFWQRFLLAGLDRKSTVLALGGGVIGDLAGFAASTFMRGVQWVNIPTTLLAMVDSSLGGKTGFDLPEGKNLVGAFHPARLIIANPYLLATLPDAELRSGLAEVVKHGIIADPTLFDLCSQGYATVKANLPEVARRGMAVKIKVIEADPYEQGLRAALNFGHTLGHALETVSNFRIRHGEGVAIGMVAEAQLAERLGVARQGLSGRIADTLKGLGLPVKIPTDLPREELIRAMLVDKKREKGIVRFAFPQDIGKVQVGVPVEDLNTIFANPSTP